MAVGLKEEAYKVLRQGIGVPKYIQEDAIRVGTLCFTLLYCLFLVL